jgi:cation transport regulator ChaB
MKQIDKGTWTSTKLAVWGQDRIWCYTKFFYETEKTSHISPDILDILELEDANNKDSTEYQTIIKDNRLRSTGVIKELLNAAFEQKDKDKDKEEDEDKETDKEKDKYKSKSDLEELVKKLSPEAKETLKKLLGTS